MPEVVIQVSTRVIGGVAVMAVMAQKLAIITPPGNSIVAVS